MLDARTTPIGTIFNQLVAKRLLLFGLILAGSEAFPAEKRLPIVVGPRADRLERLATEELAAWLGATDPILKTALHPPQPSIPVPTDAGGPITNRTCPGEGELETASSRFPIVDRVPSRGPAVLLGTLKSSPQLKTLIDPHDLERPGGYLVTTRRQGDRDLGIIAGADPRAVLHAVYALAEHLGHGFYLSYNASELAAARGEAPFDFAGWELRDAPLVGDRIVFDWHNFLSSCSTWNLPEWQHWIRQAARMRFTGIMVHAYGNNPMVQFTFRGQTKPVGYLTTTIKGRDWGTQHVNDVRRLVGAEGLFSGPVFGADAAMVAEKQRAAAAKSLMKQVFAYAKDHGVDVVFALDVDTESSNPPNVIQTLPAGARFTANGRTFADPDTPEGCAYYRAQVESLLNDYPQIDQLIVWFRTGRTPWRDLREKDFPERWKAEYREALAARPQAKGLKDSPSMFAIAKIVRAFRKALDGMGRGNVKLGIGTWNFGHMEAADAFMPREVAFLALDASIEFDTLEVQKQIRDIGAKRPVIPIVWAHHDDRTYIGRSYTPLADFGRKLQDAHAAGFGIIHWTTRPLDLYFKSLAQQTWQRTAKEPLAETCREMAARSFGPACRDSLGRYLLEWITTAPQFGRETSDRLIDRALDDPQGTIDRARRRLALLEGIATRGLSPSALERLEYYKGMERFIIEFFRNEVALQQSVALAGRGDAAGARQAIRSCRPEAVIDQYARASRQGGMTRGEMALVISMNLRWLPYFEGQRQALGLSPLRVNFQPTQHDPLAQGAGHRTFFMDEEKQLWLGLGEAEIKAPVTLLSGRPAKWWDAASTTVRDTGIAADQPLRFSLKTITGGRLPKGAYTVDVLLPRPADVGADGGVFDLVLGGSKASHVTDRIDLAETTGIQTAAPTRSYSLRVENGQLEVELRPVRGKAVVCGMVVRSVGS